MLSWGYEFVLHVVVFDALFHGCQAFVVEDLFFDSQPRRLHSVYYALVGSDHFALRPVLHWRYKYVVCIQMDGYHDIAVASLRCMGESTRLVCVDLLG